MKAGLDGVVAVVTSISEVDGDRGRLLVRGRSIGEMAGRVTYEQMGSLLWDQPLSPAALGQARARVAHLLRDFWRQPMAQDPMAVLVQGLGVLAGTTEMPEHLVTAALPVLAAGAARRQAGLEPVMPSAAAGQAEDLLRMLRGRPPSAAAVEALETYLVTVAEHGMNASTFTARVVASTQAGLTYAVIAALGALKGPLHGGAPGPVLEMLDEIDKPERAPDWMAARLAAGDRLMGFGHRIYRVRDPRADILKAAVSRLRERADTPRLALAEAVEAAALEALHRHKPGRPLKTNVEFYTALLLEALDLPRPLFTPVFAVGRVLGWTAHVLEQERDGRLMRPQSAYIGPRYD